MTDSAKVIAAAGKILARKPHDYVKDPSSGAGNCWCGAHDRSPLHCTCDYGFCYDQPDDHPPCPCCSQLPEGRPCPAQARFERERD